MPNRAKIPVVPHPRAPGTAGSPNVRSLVVHDIRSLRKHRRSSCRRCAAACPIGVDNALIAREIRKLGVHVGITLNPETPADAVYPALDEVDLVLVMSVHPGFGGQSFMPEVLDKVTAIAQTMHEQTGKTQTIAEHVTSIMGLADRNMECSKNTLDEANQLDYLAMNLQDVGAIFKLGASCNSRSSACSANRLNYTNCTPSPLSTSWRRSARRRRNSLSPPAEARLKSMAASTGSWAEAARRGAPTSWWPPAIARSGPCGAARTSIGATSDVSPPITRKATMRWPGKVCWIAFPSLRSRSIGSMPS